MLVYQVLLENKHMYSETYEEALNMAKNNNMPLNVVRPVFVSDEPIHLVSIDGTLTQFTTNDGAMRIVLESKLSGKHAEYINCISVDEYKKGLIQ